MGTLMSSRRSVAGGERETFALTTRGAGMVGAHRTEVSSDDICGRRDRPGRAVSLVDEVIGHVLAVARAVGGPRE